MLKYKLTNQDNTTHNNTLWGENVTHETDGSGGLCSKGWLHFYHSAELAVLLNPVHADIQDPKLWECEAEGQLKDDRGLKGGCTRLTTLREIPVPIYTRRQICAFGILCVQAIQEEKDERWAKWASQWLLEPDPEKNIVNNFNVYFANHLSFAETHVWWAATSDPKFHSDRRVAYDVANAVWLVTERAVRNGISFNLQDLAIQVNNFSV